MGEKTKIEWAEATWNPVTGCLHGCEYCYARRIANRFGGWGCGYTNNESGEECDATEADGGLHELDEVCVNEPFGGIATYPYYFDPTFHRYRLGQPQRWKKPRNIFVCSMADLFGAWVPDAWIEKVFAACEKAPQHRYLFLTKNPERYLELAADDRLPKGENLWYGTTATTPNAPFFWADGWNTFISIEPLLEDFADEKGHIRRELAQWVIVGAETGKRDGKITPEKKWIDSIAKTCNKQGIPVFMKDSLAAIIGEENMRREFPWMQQTQSGKREE